MTPTSSRILIVDDNPAIHEDFRKILAGPSGRGAELDRVESIIFDAPAAPRPLATAFDLGFAFQGREALDLVWQARAESRPYALAFVDVRMPPGWDGVETIHHLWEADPLLQVVVCTAYSDYSWEKMSARLGLNDNLVILKKPFDNIEVLQLAHSLTKKWVLTRQAQLRIEDLDRMVVQRTAAVEQASVELRRSEERFGTAFRANPIALAIQSLHERRFVDVNAAFTAMTGINHEEAIGRTPDELSISFEFRDPLVGIGVIRNAEAQLKTRGRELRHVLISTAHITLGGDAHVLLMMEDISERVQLEAQLRQSQKMEAIGQLAAGVAHDFNNLLTIIEGHASLQLAEPDISKDLAESLEQIEQAAERAADLTRQLLAFSRRQIMRPRVFNLNSLVDELSGMLRRVLGEKVELRCNFEEGLPLVCVDRTSIEQVVMNLALNARDAMPKGGAIHVFTKSVEITKCNGDLPTEALPGRYVCLGVSDSGTGIDEAIRGRIFEPFFTTKEINKGTGMGLATVYGIARQHEGWIDVSTAPGAGSTFRVHFPVTDKQPEPAPVPEAVMPSPEQQATIFIVEDDDAVRGLVREILLHNDFDVIEAETGDAALEKWPLIRDDVDLLLTDMVMPGEHNGLDLAEKLLADKPELKVIYSSGYSSDLFCSGIELREGFNYLPKPYLSSKLVAILRQVLAEETFAQ